ncbi:MAG: U32 family peptidase [Clostridiales bacterium]|nr:U32 family peptidase [Clostridiales bacterium]
MLEILAPAGNAESAKAAFDNGADAIYLGYSAFSARQSAENFTLDTLLETVKNAHFYGVKVYVAMNTVVKQSELDEFCRTLLAVWSAGVDAIIMQDALLGKAVKARYPEIVLHLSTQAGVCNADGAAFVKACGFSRVILARETPLAEIKKIAAIIETEAFVQGALCTCFSGQCYFSSFAGGNSGNRGRCKQPCRKLYAYSRNGNAEKNYALSLSDLSVGEKIQSYIDAGVTSFKIEGRMRRPEYVAAAVRYYKTLLNGGTQTEKDNALSDLKRTYNRGNYTQGLAFGQDKRLLSTAIQGHIGEKVGVVKVENGKYYVESPFKPSVGDAFKILRDGKEIGGATFGKIDGKRFVVLSKLRLKNGDGVFITTDTAVNNRVMSAKRVLPVNVRLRFCVGEKACAECGDLRVYSDEVLTAANSRALTSEEVVACFLKTDGLPIEPTFSKIDIQGDIFIAKSQLNAFRRQFYAALYAAKTNVERMAYEYQPFTVSIKQKPNNKTAVIASNFTGLETDIAVYKADDYAQILPESFVNGAFEKYVYYPPFATSEDIAAMEKWLGKTEIDGVYAENYAAIEFARRNGLKIFAGSGLHLCNTVALQTFFEQENAAYYALSKELNENELSALVGENAFVLALGDIKLMDLCYCPFKKTCRECDKKRIYTLTDENDRVFPVRRYKSANGECRFEVYNCANLIGLGQKSAGKLLDLTLTEDKRAIVAAKDNVGMQKTLYKTYTAGHLKRGVL